MFSSEPVRLILVSLLLALTPLRGDEVNLWPIYVQRKDPARGIDTFQALGPLLFSHAGAKEQRGIRPLVMDTISEGTTEGNFLYPFFTWRRQSDGFQSFSFFQLINQSDLPASALEAAENRFDIWPFYFSRQTSEPTTSYRALFPLGGTLKNRFGHDQIHFTLFPLYMHTKKAGREITHAPWPFLRFIAGEGYRGFEFWPFFGRSRHTGEYDHQFWLWPLGYKSVDNLSEPVPDVKVGILPFYSRDTGPGYIRENYVWPFFGYSQVTAPYHYDEKRFFWPLLVQGRGDGRLVNRWAPLYSHSIIKGSEKTWVLWPLFRNQRWQAEGLAQEKTTVLFFVWWNLEQHSVTNPDAAPARKTHLWPLFSAWNNGAGSRQVQVLSPMEVFFPQNDTIRSLWSPLFAVYRYDHQPDNSTRHSLLWDAVTWQRGPTDREFHLGPLFSVQTDATRKRIAIGNGLLGWQRSAIGRWRVFLFDFQKRNANKAEQATP
jgi:hypothetical protein